MQSDDEIFVIPPESDDEEVALAGGHVGGTGAARPGRPRRPDEHGTFYSLLVEHTGLHEGSPLSLSFLEANAAERNCYCRGVCKIAWEYTQDQGRLCQSCSPF